MQPWVACPAADYEEALNFLRIWRARGYKTALLFDEHTMHNRKQACGVDKLATFLDASITVGQYDGWPRACQMLAEMLYGGMNAEVVVFCGTDMDPDMRDGREPETLCQEFVAHFGGTCGIMQPTGDPWGNGAASRICGSPWIGKDAWKRLYSGNGPFCTEYNHFYADEELKEVADAAGILWQRPDVQQWHHHWSRDNRPRPDYLHKAQNGWDDDKAVFQKRMAAGFPGAWPEPHTFNIGKRMKIVSGMLARNEEWCLRATIPAALDWCDEVVFLDDESDDATPDIARSFNRVHYERIQHGKFWNEMDNRQLLRDLVMARGATHFALVDADEMLPIPFRDKFRAMAVMQKPNTCLCPRALNPWNSLDVYRTDDCQWTRNHWSALIRCGDIELNWLPRDGYHHHQRVPPGIREVPVDGGDNVGVIHLQFANLARRKAKHDWYMVTELVRWGDRLQQSTVASLNVKYGAAFNEIGLKTKPVPETWFKPSERSAIDVTSPGWYIEDTRAMFREYGAAMFAKLNLHFRGLYL